MTGIGALLITPVIGDISDKFGRKRLLAVPLLISISPIGRVVLSGYWIYEQVIMLLAPGLVTI